MANTLFDIFKKTYSTILLIFSVVIVSGLMFNNQTSVSQDAHPAVAFVVFWLIVIWLSMVEGGQASLVGLAPIDEELYKDSHPISYKNTVITNKGDNLDRYLMGRQFMVIFIVFIINLCGAPLAGAEIWGLPKWITDIFLVGGLAMILLTAMIGQLQTQVNASRCMLDFINNYFALFTLYVCNLVEFTGVMHSSYLIQMFVGWLAKKPIQSKEGPRSGGQACFFYGRCIMSVVILGFCFAVTLAALFDGKTTMWEGVPPAVAVILFFLLMSVVGLLEGMQIAFFAVAKLTKAERGSAKCAKMTCDLLYKGKGHNLPGFMIGRQLCVVSCFFVIARVTTIEIAEGESNIFGVSDGFQNLFDTGLLGAIITTIVGSISWQLVASAFPIAFLSNPFTYIFLRICLFLEWTGICAGAWVLAAIHKKISHFQYDEVYIGTAEERAAKNHGDHEENMHVGPGHMAKLPFFAEECPASLQELMKSDPSVRAYLESLHEENNVSQKGIQDTDSDVESGRGADADGAFEVQLSQSS